MVYLPVPVADTVPNGSTAVNNNNDHEGTLQSPNEGIYKLSKFVKYS